MPQNLTPKQTRTLYKAIMRASNNLRKAIFKAEQAGLIFMDMEKYGEQTPLRPFFQMEDRIAKCTEKQLANALRTEIANELRRK